MGLSTGWIVNRAYKNEEGIIQTETRKMVDIAINHKQLQGKPQMKYARSRAISKIINNKNKNIKIKT